MCVELLNDEEMVSLEGVRPFEFIELLFDDRAGDLMGALFVPLE